MAWTRRFVRGCQRWACPIVVGVTGVVTVWPPGRAPLATLAYSGRGVVPTRQRLEPAEHQRPQSIKALAFELAPSQWRSVEWREGSNFTLRSRFARVRVRPIASSSARTCVPKNDCSSNGPKATRSR